MPKKGCSHGPRTANGRCPSQKKHGPQTKRAYKLGATRQFKSLIAKRAAMKKTRSSSSKLHNEYLNALRQRRVKSYAADAQWDKHGRHDVDAYVQKKMAEEFPKSYDELDSEEKEFAKQLYEDPSYTYHAPKPKGFKKTLPTIYMPPPIKYPSMRDSD